LVRARRFLDPAGMMQLHAALRHPPKELCRAAKSSLWFRRSSPSGLVETALGQIHANMLISGEEGGADADLFLDARLTRSGDVADADGRRAGLGLRVRPGLDRRCDPWRGRLRCSPEYYDADRRVVGTLLWRKFGYGAMAFQAQTLAFVATGSGIAMLITCGVLRRWI
jgi:hypothetical protein